MKMELSPKFMQGFLQVLKSSRRYLLGFLCAFFYSLQMTQAQSLSCFSVQFLGRDTSVGKDLYDLLCLHGSFELDSPREDVLVIVEEDKTHCKVSYKQDGKTVPLYSGLKNSCDVYSIGDKLVADILKEPGFFKNQLVFVSDVSGFSEIYTSDLLFKKVLKITQDRSIVMHPCWQHDGEKIAYTTYKFKQPTIAFMDMKTHNALTPFRKFSCSSVVFSPKDDKVAFIANIHNIPQLCVYSLNKLSCLYQSSESGLKSSPCWINDSTLVCSSDLSARYPDMYLCDLQKLKPCLRNAYTEEYHWNGEALLFTGKIQRRFQIGLNKDIEHFKDCTFVTQGPQEHLEAQWLSDNRHFVCTERMGAKRQLVLGDTKTHKRIRLNCQKMKNTYQADIYANN